MPLVPREHPYPGYRFTVEVSIPGGTPDKSTAKGAFAEVSGLESSVEVIEYRTGKDAPTALKRLGQRKNANIVLKRGVTGNIEFWKWLVQGANGTDYDTLKADGTITLRNEAGADVMTWKFKNGWPCKFTGPGLNAKNNEVAMETVEICHEGLAVDTDGQQG